MNLIIFNVFLLALIAGIGVAVVVEDISRKRIPNSIIMSGLVVGLVLYAIGLSIGVVTMSYVGQIVVNAGIALCVSYLFWTINFWPAGDAKLFTLFVFLLPLHYYWKNYLPFFPAITFLVNVFVCAYVMLAAFSLAYLVGQLRRGVTVKGYFGLMFPSVPGRFSVASIIRTFKSANFGKASMRILLLTGFVCVPLFIVGSDGKGMIDVVRSALSGKLVWVSFSLVIRKYIADNEAYTKNTDEIQTGEFPLITLREAETFPKEFMKELGSIKADGLDEEQVDLLQAFLTSKGITSIVMQRNMPFSPWIVAGLLMTMLFNDSIIQVIRNVFL